MDSQPSDDPAWYQNRQRKVSFEEAEVASFVRKIGKDVAPGREFAVVVTSDGAVREANGRFRGKREITDVLSFPDGGKDRLGDIMIAAGRAARQARELGHRVEDELKLLTLHGLLHLLGFDHAGNAGRMRREETHWRKRFGLEKGLIERAQR